MRLSPARGASSRAWGEHNHYVTSPTPSSPLAEKRLFACPSDPQRGSARQAIRAASVHDGAEEVADVYCWTRSNSYNFPSVCAAPRNGTGGWGITLQGPMCTIGRFVNRPGSMWPFRIAVSNGRAGESRERRIAAVCDHSRSVTLPHGEEPNGPVLRLIWDRAGYGLGEGRGTAKCCLGPLHLRGLLRCGGL